MPNLKRADAEVLATETARIQELMSSPHMRAHVWNEETLKADLEYLGLTYSDDEIAGILAELTTSGFLVPSTDEPTPPRARSTRTR